MITSSAFTMNTLSSPAGAAAAASAASSSASRRRAQRRLQQQQLSPATATNSAAALQPMSLRFAAAAADEPSAELSFYDSPRSCSPASPSCMDMDMYSPASSPQRRSAVSTGASEHHHHHHPKSVSCFKFAQPSGAAPKSSPPRSLLQQQQQLHGLGAGGSPPQSISCFRPFNSVSTDSVDSMDDDYMDLLDMETAMDDELPSHFNSIISGTIRSPTPPPPPSALGHGGQQAQPRVPLRRCLSLIENSAGAQAPQTPETMRMLTGSYHHHHTPLSAFNGAAQQQGSAAGRAFKRPEAPAFSPTHSSSKRFKGTTTTPSPAGKENQPQPPPPQQLLLSHKQLAAVAAAAAAPQRHMMRKSISMNDASIMSALARSSTEPDLIGDFSRPYALPLIDGRHRDLKSITAATMARLMRGDYAATVASFRVVDCRYPYEFEGGHIAGAENLYTQEAVLRELVHSRRGGGETAASVQPGGDAARRHIVVFHCEFSSERGPKLSRFLRNHDRQCNTNVYPALHYPEVYLLHGGYKEFYEQNAALCAPIAYRPMLDPEYGAAYKHFRAQTKSWSGDAKVAAVSTVPSTRLMKSRSRLVL